ncbi:MAG: hypothetical protein ACKOW5_11075, partial [Actinomycetales bacterium]
MASTTGTPTRVRRGISAGIGVALSGALIWVGLPTVTSLAGVVSDPCAATPPASQSSSPTPVASDSVTATPVAPNLRAADVTVTTSSEPSAPAPSSTDTQSPSPTTSPSPTDSSTSTPTPSPTVSTSASATATATASPTATAVNSGCPSTPINVQAVSKDTSVLLSWAPPKANEPAPVEYQIQV